LSDKNKTEPRKYNSWIFWGKRRLLAILAWVADLEAQIIADLAQARADCSLAQRHHDRLKEIHEIWNHVIGILHRVDARFARDACESVSNGMMLAANATREEIAKRGPQSRAGPPPRPQKPNAAADTAALANSKSLGWLSFCATPRKYGNFPRKFNEFPDGRFCACFQAFNRGQAGSAAPVIGEFGRPTRKFADFFSSGRP
jgi:hypothetical protein